MRKTVFAATTIAVVVCTMASRAVMDARQPPAQPIDQDDIGGVVTGPRGPEAGVWVIAETSELPTRFVRIVVTDDQGRYVIPDLPKASYSVWVRGYGLVDSKKVASKPGSLLNLTAVAATNPHEAAQYYPAGSWFSLLHVPPKKDFPGTSANGISPQIRSQAEWLRNVKSGGCWACHQLGDKATREIPAALGTFPLHRGGLDPAHSVRTGRPQHDRRHQPARVARDRAVRRLERSHRQRRSAARTAASARHRAERGHHRMGLGGSQGVPARRSVHGPAASDDECQRIDLRRTGAERGLSTGARSRAPHDLARAADGARRSDAANLTRHAAALAQLGERGDLDEPEQRAQSDVRRAGPRLDYVRDPRIRESGSV